MNRHGERRGGGRRAAGGAMPRAARLRGLALALALAGAAAGAGGCDAFAWILVKTVGPWVPEDTVQAEYDLKGRSLLVLVDTKDPGLASEFPRVEMALAEAISKVLSDGKASGPVVSAYSVETVRRTEPAFRQWSVAQVGKRFNVDLVVHVELFEFRLKDMPASPAYRGYSEAGVRIVSPETGEQVWPVLAAARLVTAETQPDVEAEQASQLETILVDGLAGKIARQFCTYKREDLPLRPKVR